MGHARRRRHRGELRKPDALTAIARNFRAWYDSGPPDIGNQTRSVLRAVGPEPTGATMTAAAERLHARTGRTAGIGSLMLTALHCVAAQNRTPTVTTAYAMHRGIKRDVAYGSIRAALPAATPNPGFRAALKRLEQDASVAG